MRVEPQNLSALKSFFFFPPNSYFTVRGLSLIQMTCRTVMPQRKRRIRSARILTASRHVAVLPCELISFPYVAPGLAVIVRIPAAQEREELFVLSDLQGVWGDLKVADCNLSVPFLIFLEIQRALGAHGICICGV